MGRIRSNGTALVLGFSAADHSSAKIDGMLAKFNGIEAGFSC